MLKNKKILSLRKARPLPYVIFIRKYNDKECFIIDVMKISVYKIT